MSNLKYKIVAIVFFLMSINLVGCEDKNITKNEQMEIIETSSNQIIEGFALKDNSQTDVNLECEKLLDLSEKAYNFADDTTVVEEFVSALWSYITSNEDLECLKNITGIDIITPLNQTNALRFNLIRYDGNSIGLGTLERTWTFLQVINDKIEVYRLFDKSAEYPLYIKTLDLPDKNHLISVAGATNVSRSHTAFINFWEYSSDGIKDYTGINLNSNYINDKLNGNKYYIEFFSDNNVQITDADEKLGLYDITGSDFKVSSVLQNDTIVIKTSDLN